MNINLGSAGDFMGETFNGVKVGGVVGMLIAVPVAALIKLQFEKYVEKRRQTNIRK